MTTAMRNMSRSPPCQVNLRTQMSIFRWQFKARGYEAEAEGRLRLRLKQAEAEAEAEAG